VDPVEEMIFFWNGHSRMTNEQLQVRVTKISNGSCRAMNFFFPANSGAFRRYSVAFLACSFDIFVTRKLAKWEARAKEWNVSLVDAIGVDPVEALAPFQPGQGLLQLLVGHATVSVPEEDHFFDRIPWSFSGLPSYDPCTDMMKRKRSCRPAS
jgi:hypothetical protein